MVGDIDNIKPSGFFKTAVKPPDITRTEEFALVTAYLIACVTCAGALYQNQKQTKYSSAMKYYEVIKLSFPVLAHKGRLMPLRVKSWHTQIMGRTGSPG